MSYQTIITPASLAENLDTPNWLILDCRDTLLNNNNNNHQNFLENCIPNAHCCLMDDVFYKTVNIDKRHFLPAEPTLVLEELQRQGFDEFTQIVIYEDLNSSFTDTIWLKFRSLGLKNVAVLQGGFTSWKDQNLPLCTGSKSKI